VFGDVFILVLSVMDVYMMRVVHFVISTSCFPLVYCTYQVGYDLMWRWQLDIVVFEVEVGL